MLLNGFNVVGFNWLSSPAATELEMVVMEWLLKLLQLPKSFSFSSDGGGGVLLGTTCEAFICTLLAENVRQIMTTMSMNFQLSPLLLNELVQRDVDAGLIPMYLCATVGTTSTTSVDPLGPLCEVSSAYDIWVHVDAAYAGSACICPEFSHFLDGVEGASSFSFNAHKWLLTNLSCCCLWVKDRSALMKPLTTNSEYLRNYAATDSRDVVNYKDWQITLTRRFQALKIWMVLRSYGTNGLREFIRKHVKMAQYFEAFVHMDKRFEIIVPRNFSVVCFRVSPYVIGKQCDSNHEANEFNQKLLESVNATGQIYMTNSVVGGIYVIRFAVGATLTEDRHVQIAWELVKDQTTSLLTDRVVIISEYSMVFISAVNRSAMAMDAFHSL